MLMILCNNYEFYIVVFIKKIVNLIEKYMNNGFNCKIYINIKKEILF